MGFSLVALHAAHNTISQSVTQSINQSSIRAIPVEDAAEFSYAHICMSTTTKQKCITCVSFDGSNTNQEKNNADQLRFEIGIHSDLIEEGTFSVCTTLQWRQPPKAIHHDSSSDDFILRHFRLRDPRHLVVWTQCSLLSVNVGPSYSLSEQRDIVDRRSATPTSIDVK